MYISNLVHTTRFWNNLHHVRSKLKDWNKLHHVRSKLKDWNNLHHVRSKLKDWNNLHHVCSKPQYLKVFGSKKTKGPK
jgi:hypothetical protein